MRTWLCGFLGLGFAVVIAASAMHFSHRPLTVLAASAPAPVFVPHATAAEHATHMGDHMLMTDLQPAQPGDEERARRIEEAAHKVAASYVDYRKALADGYVIEYPNSTQGMYHFLRPGPDPFSHFDLDKPPLLIYSKPGGKGPEYKLVGVMYMAPFTSSSAELNSRVPLSVGRWHAHTDVCFPADSEHTDWIEHNARFGIDGSIETAAACKAAGGTFHPVWGGWMVHVFPFETRKDKIWEADMHSSMGEDEGGMKMGPGATM